MQQMNETEIVGMSACVGMSGWPDAVVHAQYIISLQNITDIRGRWIGCDLVVLLKTIKSLRPQNFEIH